MTFRRSLAALCCSGALLLVGCSSVKEELKPVKLEPISAHFKFVRDWSKGTGAGQDARYARLQPAYADGVLYTVDVDGVIGAWRSEDGKRLWRNKLKTAIGSGVGISAGVGFVGTLDGRVIAFDLADGQQKWQAKASSEVLAIPQSNGEVVITQAIDGRVFAFALKDGRQLWTYDHPVPVLSLRSNASPLILGDVAIVAFDNGQLLSFDCSSGQLRWSARVGQPQGKTELERLVDVDSAPIELGPYIYGAGYNTRLVAIAKGTGRIAWAQDVSTSENMAGADNRILISDANSHVKAFDALNGTLLWENKTLHRRGLSAPAVFGEMVVVVDREGYLHGLSLQDGTLVARNRIGENPIFAQPLAIDDKLFLLNKDGVLMAYETEATDSNSSFWDMPSNRQKGAISTKPTGVK
jgi:outer membrane protein assembly factor BamB